MSEAAMIDLAVMLPQPLSALPAHAVLEQSFGELLESLELPPQQLPADDQAILLGISRATAESALILQRSSNDTRPGVVVTPALPRDPTAAVGVAPSPAEPVAPAAAIAVGAKPSPHPDPSPATAASPVLGGAVAALLSKLQSASAMPSGPVRAAPWANSVPESNSAPTPALLAIPPGKAPAVAGAENPLEFQLPQVPPPEPNPGSPRGTLAIAGSPGPRLTAPAPAAGVAGEGRVATVVVPLETATTVADHPPSVAASRSSDRGMLHAGPELARQLGERLDWMVRTHARSAEIKVWPRDLGTVRIKLSVNSEAVEIVMEASSPRMLDELHQAVPRLRSLLSEQGLGLTHLEIDQQRSEGGRQDASRYPVGSDNSLAEERERAPEESAELPKRPGGEAIQRLVDVFA